MTAQVFDLNATPRKDLGKGASRRLRRSNNDIPAIIYGAKKDAMPITLAQKQVAKALENDAFYSHILTLHVEGKKEKVILKDMQRHPYKPHITHMDFLRISEDNPITVHAPLHFIGEEGSPGVKLGGIVSHHLTDLEIRCLPKDLPEFIEIDLSTTELGTIIHLSDIKLPEGVSLTHSVDAEHDLPVVSVHKAKKVVIEEEEAPVEATAAETEEEAKASEEDTKKSES